MPSVERDVPPDPREPRTRGPLVPPEAEFTAQANGTEDLYAKADEDYEAFWADQARSRLSWSKEFTEVLDWSKAPFATWFADGELNVAYNCVDRHVEAGNGDKVAIHFVGEPDGDTRDITYAELHEQVQQGGERAAGPRRRQGRHASRSTSR